MRTVNAVGNTKTVKLVTDRRKFMLNHEVWLRTAMHEEKEFRCSMESGKDGNMKGYGNVEIIFRFLPHTLNPCCMPTVTG